MTRRTRVVAWLGTIVLAAGGLATALPAAPASAAPVTIQLLNINDFHGRIDANTTKWATTIEQLRASNPNSLLLGAGDLIGASVFASAVANDQPTIDVMNAMELDASAVGNHELDKGWRTSVIGSSVVFPGSAHAASGTTSPPTSPMRAVRSSPRTRSTPSVASTSG